MESFRENSSVISKLKAAGGQADALRARLFFERLFAPADFHPNGISRRAIVCIRKISTPGFKGFGGSANGHLAVEWEAGIRGEIEKMFRRAFRPFREFVPASAECVIFEDKAEMLACLARDWMRGALIENWWWRGLYPKLFRAGTVAEIWIDEARDAPAALQVLAKTNDARDFVKKLQPDETVKLLRKIIRLFGLRELDAALFEPVAKTEEILASELVKAAEKSRFQAKEKTRIFTKLDSFFAGLSADFESPNLTFHRQTLLAVGLVLARSPRAARSLAFAALVKIERLRRELPEKFAGKEIVEIIKKARAPEKDEKTRALPKQTFREKSAIQKVSAKPEKTVILEKSEKFEKTETLVPVEETSEKIERRIEKESAEKQETVKSKKTTEITFETVAPEKKTVKPARKTEAKGEKNAARKAENRLFEEYFEDFERETEYSFETRFGGVFYLLNLGLFLGLYRDFTESLESEVELNIWDFVALLGLEFLGEKIKTDEIWNFLLQAAERENDDFKAELKRFQDWRTPTGWLETFPKKRGWIFRKTGNRLILRHAAGFNVLDIQMRGETQSQLKKESEIYAGYFSQIRKAERKDFSSVKSKNWLKNLAEFLEKRLFQALNLETREELNALLFERRATAKVSATHLEITFGLADLPFEIRLAGIDRDPGWIPAAGKYVYFHYV